MAGRTAALTVRERRPSDDDFIRTLGERVFAPYSLDASASVGSMLEEGGAEVAIAEVGRTRAGFCVLGYERLVRTFGPWVRPTLARLNAIAVRPELHGRGIGSVLLACAEEMARAQGAVSILLNTAETNMRARRLFGSAGFLPVVRIPNTYRRGQPAIAMFKVLELDAL